MNQTMSDPEAWKEAWQRSKRLQRALRERGTPTYHVNAQAEYDYCDAVSKTPRDQIPPTAKEWFREDVPVPRAAAVDATESAPSLHAMRPADAPAAGAGTATAVASRWREIVGERGGSYGSHVRSHLWGIVYVALGVIIGAFSRTTCR